MGGDVVENGIDRGRYYAVVGTVKNMWRPAQPRKRLAGSESMAPRTSIETQAVLHASLLHWLQFVETEKTIINVLRAERDEGVVGKLTAKNGDMCIDCRVQVDSAEIQHVDGTPQLLTTFPDERLVQGFRDRRHRQVGPRIDHRTSLEPAAPDRGCL